MKTAKEIESSINSIRYYTDKIYELAQQQFEADAQIGDINTQVGTIRFDNLGNIGAGCNWIKIYCDNMEVSMKRATEQDKLLQIKEKSNG